MASDEVFADGLRHDSRYLLPAVTGEYPLCRMTRPISVRFFLLFALPLLTFAQAPTIGFVDIYGARKVTADEIRKQLAITEGGHLPASKGDMEERLEEMPGIVTAHIEAACCDEGKVILYIGIEEKGAPHFDYRVPPTEEIRLPEEVTSAYDEFLQAVRATKKSGQTSEDLSRGYSLIADPNVRAAQLRFVPLANTHFEALRKVLRNSSSEEQRAIAAYVIGYADRKTVAVDDLQYALQDSDDTVRNNAIRSLAAFAVLAQKDKDSELRVSPTWLIEMLNSVVWSDRNNAAIALVNLTESRDARVLGQIRERALPALREMAGWQYLAHALPAYIVLGRVEGVPEEQLRDLWSKGDRGTVIKGAAASNKK